jgi:predicted outer membrane repeat protein
MKLKIRPALLGRSLAAILILLATNLHIVRALEAATLTITSCDSGQLISAITIANSDSAADIINLAPGCVYTLGSGSFNADGQNGLPDISSPISINGNGATIARDSALGTPAFRILHIAISGALLLNTVTISNGLEVRGGGIYSSGTLTMANTNITNNQVITTTNNTFGLGGGVYIGSGRFTLDNSSITYNSAQGVAEGRGAGIFLDTGNAFITNSILAHNRVTRRGRGGAISVNQGVLEITNCIFDDNEAAGFGGGLYSTGVVTVTQSNFRNNRAVGSDAIFSGNFGEWGRGGGIASEDGVLTITGTSLSQNQALGGSGPIETVPNQYAAGTGQGGGLYLLRNSTSVRNSSITQNRAAGGDGGLGIHQPGGAAGDGNGGGIALVFGKLMVLNSTLSGNLAIGAIGGAGPGGGQGGNGIGGGIEASGTLTVTDSTIVDNHAAGGLAGAGAPLYPDGAAGGGGISTYAPTLTTVGNTIIALNTTMNTVDAAAPNVAGTFISQGYNLIGDGTGSTGFNAPGDQVGTTANPIDPLVGPLADNGGASYTHALLSGSPAIDAGNPAPAGSDNACSATDQRGFGRVGRCDIGAFEFGNLPLKKTTTTLISSENPARIGETVTFTATVVDTSSDIETPTGNVTFYDGAIALGSSTLNNNGRAVLSVALLMAGNHTILANYSGDANYAPSSAPNLTQTIVQTTIIHKMFLPLLHGNPQLLAKSMSMADREITRPVLTSAPPPPAPASIVAPQIL